MKDHYIFFKDTKNGQALYNVLKDVGIRCTIAPTPKTENHCCGISIIYLDENDQDRIKKIIDENNIEIMKFYEKERDVNPNRMRFC